MPNHDTLYAIIHIAWDRMIIVDTAPSTVDAMKRLFQEGNYYSEEYVNKKTCWKRASANGFPRIEIISRAEFLKKTDIPKDLEADNDNE